ncbi:ankyrin [Hyaloscypha bicolor E]|uniref:Ankyrin n=1 Tax=Hyaloscypha bicolor E TaxID=1095630 RepID=A0A2J6SI39_9HELO|nr:ankyrin [Hyaloscypha bicolor E]PMD50436.1 ankyrin [Hyaloscypha bicolor E]
MDLRELLRTAVLQGKGIYFGGTWENTTVKDHASLHQGHDIKFYTEDLDPAVQRETILKWLVTTDPSKNLNAAVTEHIETTGDWFLGSLPFKLWMEDYFNPNKDEPNKDKPNKDKPNKDKPNKDHPILAYYYFDSKRSEKRDISSLLRSLIGDLCSNTLDLPEDVRNLYYDYTATTPSESELYGTFRSVLPLSAQTYIIIDALDECYTSPQGEVVSELSDYLSKLIALEIPNLHLLVSSRDDKPAINDQLKNAIALGGYRRDFEVHNYVAGDIKTVIESRIEEIRNLRRLDTELKAYIVSSLKEKAKGMFQLVKCYIDELCTALKAIPPFKQKDVVMATLKNLPKAYVDAYRRILERIPQGEKKSVIDMLKWLAFSKRSLRLEKLYEVVTLDAHGPTESVETSRIQEYLMDTFSSLIRIREHDKTVEFSHYTVKEYLLLEKSHDEEYYVQSIDAHISIAQCCLTFLERYDIDNSSHGSTDNNCRYCPITRPLIEYAANNWYRHALMVRNEVTAIRSSKELVDAANGVTISSPGDSPDAAEVITTPKSPEISLSEWAQSTKSVIDKIDAEPYNGTLKAAAYKGYAKIVELLLLHGAPLVSGDHSVLHEAASENYQEMIQILLGWTEYRSARKSWWTDKGDPRADGEKVSHGDLEAVMWMLLERRESVDDGNGKGTTALLPQERADIEIKESGDGTPLARAIRNGSEAVTKLLLTKGAKMNYCYVPIEWNAVALKAEKRAREKWNRAKNVAIASQIAATEALSQGETWKMRKQLTKEAEASRAAEENAERKMNRWKRTPLSRAAELGHEGVVKLLLEHKADINVEDKAGRTARDLAASNGHETIAQLLLEHEADMENL